MRMNECIQKYLDETNYYKINNLILVENFGLIYMFKNIHPQM